jgi:transposase
MTTDADRYKSRTRRLDHLPIVAQAIKRLRVAEIVDSVVRVDSRSHVTTGQCVEALVMTIAMGTHTLYRVADELYPFDVELVMEWTDPEGGDVVSRFNDERLGNALEALFKCEGGCAAVNAAITMEAVKAYELELSRLHFDTSSIKTFGDYAGSHTPEDPDSPFAIPDVTYGHSKDHRPDLKQILLGITVTGDGAVPIHGRAASGNRADALECRFVLDQLAAALPDPKGSTLVGDSKFFAGETLLRARRHGFHYVTLMPQTVGVWDEAYRALDAARARGPLPVLREKTKEESGGEVERWAGVSVPLVYEYEDEDKIVTPIPIRALVVESTALRDRKRATLANEKEKERATLEKASARLAKRRLSCMEDALAAGADYLAAKPPRFHKVTARVLANVFTVKRARSGRPRNDETPEKKSIWSARLDLEDAPELFDALLAREGCFVLATDRPETGPDALTDVEFLDAYREQFKVEGRFKSAKGPLQVAPVFLKTPRRLAALTLVYIIAIMVYTLIQRETRSRLATEKTTIPGNIGWTDIPTTEVVFRLMAGTLARRNGGSGAPVTVMNMTTEQARLLTLLGNDLLERPSVHVETPTIPTRAQRGYRPPVKPPREMTNGENSISRM